MQNKLFGGIINIKLTQLFGFNSKASRNGIIPEAPILIAREGIDVIINK